VIAELVATAREFAERELRPVAMAYDESEEYPQRGLERAASLGLTCYDLPHGGGGGVLVAPRVTIVCRAVEQGGSRYTCARRSIESSVARQAVVARFRPRESPPQKSRSGQPVAPTVVVGNDRLC